MLKLISGAKLSFVFPHVGGAFASAIRHQPTEENGNFSPGANNNNMLASFLLACPLLDV